MIINNRKDLDSAPQNVKNKKMKKLANSINRWEWISGEWKIVQHTKSIERFGFTLDDFPDAPVPQKPTYNQDDRRREQAENEVREERNNILARTDFMVITDSPHNTQEVRDYRQALRDIPQQSGFPYDVTWPERTFDTP